MDFTFPKTEFITSFLNPIGKACDQCILTLNGNTVSCISHNVESGLILYGTFTVAGSYPQTNINVGDVKRLIKVLDSLDEPEITLKLDSNKLAYKSKSIKFNYHLMEDIVMHKTTIKPEKINAFQYTTEFTIPNKKIQDVLKGVSFAIDSNKLYLYTQDGAVHADLADNATPNTDSVGYMLADAFTGTPIVKPLALHLEAVRILAGIKFDQIKIRVNVDLSIVLFELVTENTLLKYILTTRVK
jgi:hypothetical protein